MRPSLLLKHRVFWAITGIVIVAIFIVTYFSSSSVAVYKTKETQACIDCHIKENIHTVQIKEWENSKHAAKGVGCFECHTANEGDRDAWDHEGYLISTIVSPADCSKCHMKEFNEFDRSFHAKAGEILGSIDNYIGEVVQGENSSVQGCQACHGSLVEVTEKGKLKPETWPNLGIGRLNPDGSKGTCSACHSKHHFSLRVARDPESCGKCHIGPDHPHKEIYEESIHGRIFLASRHRMNLDHPDWILGIHYTAAPNCVTCHMGATKDLNKTHDFGERISLKLSSEITYPRENAENKRNKMKMVCINCHGPEWVNNFYQQFDNTVDLYNNRYAKPAMEIMERLRKEGKLTPTPLDEEIEYVYFELWHHEGRRIRHGASMMGPDYVQWHGFYELAHNFYFKFLPLARELGQGEYIDELLKQPEHLWIKGVKPENLKRQEQSFAEWQKIREQFLKEFAKDKQ
jgi:hypothetical protein